MHCTIVSEVVPVRILRLFTLLLALCSLIGCETSPQEPAPTRSDIISEFVEYCYEDSVNIVDLTVSGTLVLDTLNLPSIAEGGNKLILGCNPASPWGRNSSVEFYFHDTLSTDIDPGLYLEHGWKVIFSSATAEQCTTCYTNEGLARAVILHGSLGDIAIVHDPLDTMTVFIEPRQNSD